MFCIVLHPSQEALNKLLIAEVVSIGRKPSGDALVVRMIEKLEMETKGTIYPKGTMTYEELLEHAFEHTATSEDYKFRPMSVGDVGLIFEGDKYEYWLCLDIGWRKIL